MPHHTGLEAQTVAQGLCALGVLDERDISTFCQLYRAYKGGNTAEIARLTDALRVSRAP